MEPQWKLYEDIAEGKFKLAGELIAMSICLNGPAPNFFATWIYQFILGGMECVLEHLPDRMDGKSKNV